MLWEHTGEECGDSAPQTVPDQKHRAQLVLLNELLQIVNVIVITVARALYPFRVSVAPQIRRDKVIIAKSGQTLNQIVPGAAVIANPMHENDGGILRRTPLNKVHAQTLRKEPV